jgi:hypothetical protein
MQSTQASFKQALLGQAVDAPQVPEALQVW